MNIQFPINYTDLSPQSSQNIKQVVVQDIARNKAIDQEVPEVTSLLEEIECKETQNNHRVSKSSNSFPSPSPSAST